MPYISEHRRRELETDEATSIEPGDANFLITTKFVIPLWKLNPRYGTIAWLERELNAPFDDIYKDSRLQKIIRWLIDRGLFQEEVESACRLAFLEFYRRVGSKYEDQKIAQNGDVYEGVI